MAYLLTSYNALQDENLKDYFASPAVRKNMMKTGMGELKSAQMKESAEMRQLRQMGRQKVHQTREFQLGRQLELQRQLEAVRNVQLYRRVKGDDFGARDLVHAEPSSLEKSLTKSQSAYMLRRARASSPDGSPGAGGVVEEISLRKDEAGLGFFIAGGTDNAEEGGEKGIFVTHIGDGSPAQRDGRLQVGDVIVAVNGNDIRNVTHDYAVGLIKNATEKVTLKVIKPLKNGSEPIAASSGYLTDDDGRGNAIDSPRANNISASKASHVRRYLNDYQRFQYLHALDPPSLETYRQHLETQLSQIREFKAGLPSISSSDGSAGKWRGLKDGADPASSFAQRRKLIAETYTTHQPPSAKSRWTHRKVSPRKGLPTIDGSTGSNSNSAQQRKARIEKGRVVTSAGMKQKRSPKTTCVCFLKFMGPTYRKLTGELENAPTNVVIQQQHCGSNSITVFREKLVPGAVFYFFSYRQSGYGLSLTFLEEGEVVQKTSTCCEARLKPKTRLGGPKGAFRWLGVRSALPCYKCQVERELPVPLTNFTTKNRRLIAAVVEKEKALATAHTHAATTLPLLAAANPQQRRNRRFVKKKTAPPPVQDLPPPLSDVPASSTHTEDSSDSSSTSEDSESESNHTTSESQTPTPPDPTSSNHSRASKQSSPKQMMQGREELSTSSSSSEDEEEAEKKSIKSTVTLTSGPPQEWNLPSPTPWMKPHIARVGRDLRKSEEEAAETIQRSFRAHRRKREAAKLRKGSQAQRTKRPSIDPNPAEVRSRSAAARKIQYFYRSKRREGADNEEDGNSEDFFEEAEETKPTRAKSSSRLIANAKPRAHFALDEPAKEGPPLPRPRSLSEGCLDGGDSSSTDSGSAAADEDSGRVRLSADFEKRLRRASSALLALEEKFDEGIKGIEEKDDERAKSMQSRSDSIRSSSSRGTTKYEGKTWECEICNHLNTNIEVHCRQCTRGVRPNGLPATTVSSPPPEEQEEEVDENANWTCAACNFENTPNHAQCRICQHEKGAKVPTSEEEDSSSSEADQRSSSLTDLQTASKEKPKPRRESSGSSSSPDTLDDATSIGSSQRLAPPGIAVLPATPDSDPQSSKQFVEPVKSVWDTASARSGDVEEEKEEEVKEDDELSHDGSSASQRLPRTIRNACRKSEDVSLTGLNLSDPDLAAEVGTRLGQNEKLKAVYLRGSELHDDSAAALLEGLVHTESEIKVLNVNSNHLTDASVQPLADFIKQKPLEIIMLRENKFSDAGIAELLNAIILMGDDSKLRRLDLGELTLGVNSALALKDLLASSSTLQSLILGGNKGLGTQDWIQIGEGLERNDSLEQLKLDDCEMGDKSFAFLCKGLNHRPNLKMIDLDGNSLTEKGVAYLFEVIRSCPRLEQVVMLAGNRVPSERLSAVKQLLRAKAEPGHVDRLSIQSAHFPRP